jgi:cobalt-zinc-cadmium efflux system outer membrane protein
MSRGWAGGALVVLATLAASGCAHYRPLPLPPSPDLRTAPQLTVPAKVFQVPGLNAVALPPRGLDELAVVALAVSNDPALKAARLQAGVGAAQMYAAGLLPDPVLNASVAASSVTTGYALAAAEPLQALVLRGAAQAQAAASAHQINLNILWQEFQVAEQARALFIEARSDRALIANQQRQDAVLSAWLRRDQAAMVRGDAVLSTVAADLAALTAGQAALAQRQLDRNLARRQLKALLGLAPAATLKLAGGTALPPLSPARLRQAVAALPHRRADLLALQAGYASQEQALRQAILAQFPGLTASIHQGRDVEGLSSAGVGVSLTLPLFNRNRGAIAVQRATRAMLRETYQSSLDEATGDAEQAWRAAAIQRRATVGLEARVPALRAAAVQAAAGRRQGVVSADQVAAMQIEWRNAQAMAIEAQATLATDEAAVRTLLGLPFQPPAAP